MSNDRIRRLELGKMILDIAKFIFTIVVIGGFFYDRLELFAVMVGIALAIAAAGIGFLMIPPEETSG